MSTVVCLSLPSNSRCNCTAERYDTTSRQVRFAFAHPVPMESAAKTRLPRQAKDWHPSCLSRHSGRSCTKHRHREHDCPKGWSWSRTLIDGTDDAARNRNSDTDVRIQPRQRNRRCFVRREPECRETRLGHGRDQPLAGGENSPRILQNVSVASSADRHRRNTQLPSHS